MEHNMEKRSRDWEGIARLMVDALNGLRDDLRESRGIYSANRRRAIG